MDPQAGGPERTKALNRLLLRAAETGDAANVARLLKEGADLNAANPRGSSALTLAVASQSMGTVQLLIDAGADIHTTDVLGMTALTHAAQHKDVTIARALLERGADPNVKCIYSAAPLFFATQWGNIPMIKALVDHGADLHALTLNGESVARIALAAGPHVYSALLELGLEPASAEELEAFDRHPQAFRELLEAHLLAGAEVAPLTSRAVTNECAGALVRSHGVPM